MRTIIALAYVFLSSPSLADSVRRSGMPGALLGKVGAECRPVLDKSTAVVSGKGYVTEQESCEEGDPVNTGDVLAVLDDS